MLHCTLHAAIARPPEHEIHYFMLFPQKTPNVPYLSRPMGRIEMLLKSKLHYVFQHDKQKLFLQLTLGEGDQ